MVLRHCLYLVLLLNVNLSAVDCGVTIEQMEKTAAMVRSVCLPRHKITTEMADGIKQGIFPDDKSMKCYMHCSLVLTGVMKKNKIAYDSSLRQMELLLPEEVLEDNKNGITQCKDIANGIKDACDVAYVLVQCLYKNTKKFIFP